MQLFDVIICMQITNNGKIWHLCELHVGGGPETRLPLGLAQLLSTTFQVYPAKSKFVKLI